MTETCRNILIGLTVLIAMALLAGLIIVFAGLPSSLRGGYLLHLQFDATANAHKGDPIHLNGVPIGEIVEIKFTDGDPREGVTFVARIDDGVQIPGNVRPRIVSKGLVGGVLVNLTPDPGAKYIQDAVTGRPLTFLPPGYDRPIKGEIRTGMQLPGELRGLSKKISAFLAPPPATRPSDTRPAEEQSLVTVIIRLNRVLAGLEAIVADKKNQENIQTSLAQLTTATKEATDAMRAMKDFALDARKVLFEAQKAMTTVSETVLAARKQMSRLTDKLIEDAERVSTLLATLNRAAVKIESGTGTAGRILNDPRLYENLLAVTENIDAMTKDFRELARLWKEKGVVLKMK